MILYEGDEIPAAEDGVEWVYCLQNPSFAGLIKIDQTADLEKRLKDNNRTNIPQEFELLWGCICCQFQSSGNIHFQVP